MMQRAAASDHFGLASFASCLGVINHAKVGRVRVEGRFSFVGERSLVCPLQIRHKHLVIYGHF